MFIFSKPHFTLIQMKASAICHPGLLCILVALPGSGVGGGGRQELVG